MNKLILRKMTLHNFKGIRDLMLDFREDITTISGDNGTGKTTIFDAFTWVLFGKDSRDREKFQLMTLDVDGNEIPRLDHEVSIVLDAGGKEIRLTRRKKEKWTKRRGCATEEKTGTEEERLYNDIPCSVADWNAKIEELCSFDVFKMITSPTYFVSLKPDAQREILFRMVGNLRDRDIAEGNPLFADLAEVLKEKRLEDYKLEIGSKKKRIKTELAEYPIRIKECNSAIDSIADIDFESVAKELDSKKKSLAEVIDSLSYVEAEAHKIADKKTAIAMDLNALVKQRMDMETAMLEELNAGVREAIDKAALCELKVQQLQRTIEAEENTEKQLFSQISKLKAEREKCVAEWKAIKAEVFILDEEDLRCPTCGRAFEPEDIEQKTQEMKLRFNERIASKLRENAEKGKMCNRDIIARSEDALATLQTEIAEHRRSLEDAEREMNQSPAPTRPEHSDAVGILSANKEYIALCEHIDQLKAELDKPVVIENIDREELKGARQMFESSIEELNRILGKKEIIDNRKKMITSYEEQMRIKSQKLADLERIEFNIIEFSKAKINAVEDKINSLFKIVRFRLFETQMNGGWKEACEATVDGVPYSVLNNAMRINAGLDIINAICKFEGINTPIFVDNAESVNNLLNTQSQLIRLVVTEDETLKID